MEMVCGYAYFWIDSELGSELVLNIILNIFWNGLVIIFVFGNHNFVFIHELNDWEDVKTEKFKYES